MSAPLLWFLLGIAFLLIELMAPTLVLIFFGAGAWVTACVALLGLSLNWQLVTFIFVSLFTLLFLRRPFARRFRRPGPTGSMTRAAMPRPIP